MLKISNIKKSFADHIILHRVSFEAPNSCLTILEGQNGAGKSTLFNILTGNLMPDAGEIFLDQQNITHDSAHERAHNIAILKQDPKASSWAHLSVLENCALALLKNKKAGLRYALNAQTQEYIKKHIDSLELNYDNLWHKQVGMLSGGQRQVLAFAMATMYKPNLLLLDEPSAALDDKSSNLLMRLIKKLITNWNIPAVMISHDYALNKNYGDKIIELKDGHIISRAHADA